MRADNSSFYRTITFIKHDDMNDYEIAVLVGSLRKASYNLKMAKALIELAPASLKLEIVKN